MLAKIFATLVVVVVISGCVHECVDKVSVVADNLCASLYRGHGTKVIL